MSIMCNAQFMVDLLDCAQQKMRILYTTQTFKDTSGRLNKPFINDLDDGTVGELGSISADNDGLAALFDEGDDN